MCVPRVGRRLCSLTVSSLFSAQRTSPGASPCPHFPLPACAPSFPLWGPAPSRSPRGSSTLLSPLRLPSSNRPWNLTLRVSPLVAGLCSVKFWPPLSPFQFFLGTEARTFFPKDYTLCMLSPLPSNLQLLSSKHYMCIWVWHSLPMVWPTFPSKFTSLCFLRSWHQPESTGPADSHKSSQHILSKPLCLLQGLAWVPCAPH